MMPLALWMMPLRPWMKPKMQWTKLSPGKLYAVS
jgi:hypothetical protein